MNEYLPVVALFSFFTSNSDCNVVKEKGWEKGNLNYVSFVSTNLVVP
jgi:hypothetical protein